MGFNSAFKGLKSMDFIKICIKVVFYEVVPVALVPPPPKKR